MQRRLALIYVQPGARDLLGCQRLDERGFVDYGPARSVDEDRGSLHLLELRRAENVLSLWSQRKVRRHEVGLRKEPAYVSPRRAQLLFSVRRKRMRVVVQHAHVETFGPMRDPTADAADADEAQRGSEHVSAEHHVDRPSLELSLAGEVVSLDDPASC